MLPLLTRILPSLLGFFLVANATVFASDGNSIRATDLFGLGMGVYLLLRSGHPNFPWSRLAAAGVLVFLPLVWTGLAVLGLTDRSTIAQGARWILAVPWAVILWSMLQAEPGRTRFIKGLAVGCVFNVFVIVAQQYGMDAPLQRLGFSSFGVRLVWVGEQLRMPGLHGGPTASAAVISLVAPATLWIYLRDRGNILWPAVGFATAGIALHLTASRSPLVMLVLTTLITLTLTFHRRRALLLWAIVLGLCGPVLTVYGPPGGWVRWTDTSDAALNVSDRLLSNEGAVELVMAHPLGMGVDDGHRALYEDTGIQATHNAWLQAALIFGLPMALVLALGMGVALARLRYGWKSDAFWPALVAVHLTGLFLFEEHLNNPTFVILATWLVVCATASARAPQSMRA